MTEQKMIAVVGATGAQGGGLARAILNDPEREFACRALTRKPASDAARALSDGGAEVVQADLDDEDGLAAAFAGTYGAYCMTNFFEHFSADKELEQAAALARATTRAGVRHAIWSTTEDSRHFVSLDDDRMPTLDGRYKVPHWDGKAQANHSFTDAGVPTTFLLMSMFWDNFITPGAPQVPLRGPDGVLAITLPAGDAKLPGIAGEDIGRCAYGVFKAGDRYVGNTIGVAGEHLTAKELATGLSSALGETVRYNDVPLDAVRAAPVPGVDAVANMFQIITENNADYCAHYDVGLSRSLNPRLQAFAEWLAANEHRIRVPAGTS